MLIVSKVQSDTIRSLCKKERIFEQLSLAQFPAENVKAMNNQILDKCDKLEHASSLPDDAILTITKKYCASSSEKFKIHFLTHRSSIEDHLKQGHCWQGCFSGGITPKSDHFSHSYS